jgi:hypothetical protein
MCEFEEKEKTIFLICLHRYHKDCIFSWFKEHSNVNKFKLVPNLQKKYVRIRLMIFIYKFNIIYYN